MAETAIEWATHVLNAFTGCDRVSPGLLDRRRDERGRLMEATRV